jgi:hypothetical protein
MLSENPASGSDQLLAAAAALSRSLRPPAYHLHLRAESDQSRRDSLIFLGNTFTVLVTVPGSRDSAAFHMCANAASLPSAGSIACLKLEEDVE